MNTPQLLPAYTDAALANLDTDELIELLARDEDRVPRNVIDECARRGDAIVQHLGLVLENHRWNAEASGGEWWRLLHAVMILGLVPTEAAGLLLVQYMRRMSEQDDDALQDWLAGHWPAIFDNKPASLMSALRALSEDRDFDWYIRACATDAMVAMARRVDTATLDDALTYLAATTQDEAEDRDYRMLAANTLLDFPRPQYRELLETLAKRQKKFGAFFHEDDVEKSYAKNKDKPDRGRHYKEPWAFYEPQAIAARQERWTKEEQEEREKEKAWETEGNRFEDVSDPYVRPEPKTGRNDPCPCGSGKKYKHCCLNKQEEPGPDDLAWRRLRRALDGLPKAMLRTAREHFGPDAIDEAWAEFNLWDGDEPLDHESPYLQVFLPWHLYDWLPDPEETAVAASAQAETAAAAHLRIAGRRLDPLARGYVEACMTAPFSFHEIVACDPGRSFRLRDVLLGTEVDAIEHEGSANARAGDLVYAKVVRSDGLTLVEGCTPVLIPPIYKTEIIEFREQLAAQGALFDDSLLREYEFELREIYLGIADRLLYPRMPQMANTDGDPLEFRELVFDIDSPREAFEALKGLAGVPEDEMPLEAELDATGALVRTEITWRRADSDTVLGTLRINGRRLTAEANSARRADELRRLIEERLGAGGRYRTGTIQSVESLLNREPTPAEQAAAREHANENARLAALPEVQAAIAAHLREHYRKWLDEKIPALGDRTPREAVRDPAGREAVAALILQIERDGVGMQPPLDPAIVREMRKALGL